MIKILDVSNSHKRPQPRGLGGPIENDIVRYLKKYAHQFNCQFVTDEKLADIIFTNDVFPKEYKQPKVKRMDGVYSRIELLERNHPLNLSAQQADCVVFISDFSKLSLEILYPFISLKKSVVALNASDPDEFFPISIQNKPFDFISTSNDWIRPEKRGDLFTHLALKFPHLSFALIGKSSHNLPKNITSLGYISNYSELNIKLNQSKSFVYLGFNDPAPKTVCQALNCQLPLFLTHSGGNFELANRFAYFVDDFSNKPFIHHSVPSLDLDMIELNFSQFIQNHINKHYYFNSQERFQNMLEIYFNTFKSLT